MEVKVEEIESCKMRINYTADSSVVKSKVAEAIDQLRNAPVPGFRTGQATDLAIKLKFKDKIDNWVKSQMLNHANDDIIFETKIRPIGQPQIEDLKLDGNKFSCQVLYMKKPDFELNDYKGFELPNPHVDKTAEVMVEEMLEELRNTHGDVAPYGDGDFIQKGHKVTLSYELSNGDKEEGMLYVVGSNLYPEFDQNLFGMKPDDEREFDVSINDERVSCKVTVHMGLMQIPCALDDSLAKKVNMETFEEVKAAVQGMADKQLQGEKDFKLVEQIKSRLIENHDFEIPAWLASMESQELAAREGLEWEKLSDDVKDKYASEAKSNIKFTLILDSIRLKDPESELSDAEAVEMVKRVLSHQGSKNVDEQIQAGIQDGTLFGVVSKLKNDHTMRYLVDSCKVME